MNFLGDTSIQTAAPSQTYHGLVSTNQDLLLDLK